MDHTDTPLPVAMDLPPEEPAPVSEVTAAEVPVPAAGAPEVAPVTQPPKTAHTARNTSPFRALIVVVAGFVGLFLVLRTIAVEPFGVPTGSMAPALSGHHRDGLCPRCGYTVRVGRPGTGSATEHFRKVTCPNCDRDVSLVDARDLSGDRLLVDKNIYDLRAPRRWEMVVFRCPNPNPTEFGKPYVKRLIGLPGETILIRDGDVYLKRAGDTSAHGEIARKGLAEVRETVVPVFDMNFAPNPGGWGSRWLVSSGDPRLPMGTGPDPTTPPVIENYALVLDASDAPQSTLTAWYRHWHLDERRENPVRVWNAYDGTPRRPNDLPAAHDFYVTCEVEVTATVGSAGEASFECRLADGADGVTAEIAVGPKATGRAVLVHEYHGGLGNVSGVALEKGRKYHLEFAFVDRRATLALDGRVVVPPADLEPAPKRGDVSRPVRFGARGCRVVVRDIKLYRDIHYMSDYGEHGTRHPAVLGPHEYYVLGDNSGNSEDSRKWPTPGVPESAFIGKPFLIHQPLRLGRVSVGGRERVFQTLDWSRLRWLH
ncbi:hypothetical protein J8F10_00160 [Gemmata sp. G18]|uniref:Signal peptidase I n=1 Tax=Gemmata palustris TaxID=2822762 RepID=A0ABS5BJ40_9BACT|nr:S26 family signal peptidase [Gemmata palustris]MBP3953714.1 hypothetical protein [Gemmata palustris]